MKPTRRRRAPTSTALRLIVEGTASETGIEFFRALVRSLAEVLGTSGAWVTELLPDSRRLKAFAMWLDGGFVEDYEYPLQGTACNEVIESEKVVHFPDRLIELFPEDTDLVPAAAVSYLGAPLRDSDGTVVGHLAVLDRNPMPKDRETLDLFKIFTHRAEAELRRLRMERVARQRGEETSMLIESALDAILVLDAEGAIIRVNPAAERLLACSTEDLVGECLEDFLPAGGMGRLHEFQQKLSSKPGGRAHIWVPEDFTLRRWDHSLFPAEITLSTFERNGAGYFVMTIRNSDERVEARREIERLTRETESLREAVRELPGYGELLGRSAPMKQLFTAIQQVADTPSTVLITGETGTGKELVARQIHLTSSRADHPLVTVNCAALPANLIESECFGHERGAFTGATTRREGRFAAADGGTIFLDEIGELPMELQAKLLRVLQEGTFEPLGGSRTVKVDVRVIAATHRNLPAMVTEGKFREDLFFRLNVFPVHVPALRDRGSDIVFLARALCERLAQRMGKRIEPPDDEELRLLTQHTWPGNVRELQNVVERALILSSSGRPEFARAVTGYFPEPRGPSSDPEPLAEGNGTILTVEDLRKIESDNIRRALTACGGKVSGPDGAAARLGLPPTTLSSRMKTLGIARAVS